MVDLALLPRARPSSSTPVEGLERPIRPPAPLVPVALAATAGLLFDRFAGVSATAIFLTLGLAALGCSIALVRREVRMLTACMMLGCGLLAAGWHHLRQQPPADSVGRYAKDDGVPVRLRGLMLTRRIVETRADDEPLRSRRGRTRTSATLEATELWRGDSWRSVSGGVRLSAGGELEGILPGDFVECDGELLTLQSPANPGELDARQQGRDRGIDAFLHAKTVAGISLHQTGWSLQRLLAEARRAGGSVLQRALSPDQAEVAEALLLGDEGLMASGKLEGYVRTGVYHVLAISGQHLVILCGGLWMVSRLLGVPRRRAAWGLAFFVIGYALLTGSAAPVVRAAVLVCALCGGVFLRRPTSTLNALALAWLVIVALNPAEVFQTGCQLSFLAVLALSTIVGPLQRWRRRDHDPLQQLIAQSRPIWLKLLTAAGGWLVWSMAISFATWIVCAPLLAARMHVVSPVVVLLSPFMVALTSVVLLLGFPLLLLEPLIGSAASPLAWVVEQSLKSCDLLVWLGQAVPGGHWYSAGVPDWWLAGFYAWLLPILLFPAMLGWWKPLLGVGLVWVVAGVLGGLDRPVEPALRCTFLSVGHGGCVVLETADGRVLLYDAGSMGGPEVTQRQIAPFLWSRGITRIDEVFISHADLDHFNGLPALLDRFAVAQVSLTPSFLNRAEPAVRLVKERLEEERIATRVLSAGQTLRAGEVRIEVLHPPLDGPAGNENARSLVLLIRYHGRSILLTGDLEGLGLPEVTTRPSPRPDVLLAPHHGSATSNTADFADWATGRADAGLVISSEARPRWRRADPYSSRGTTVWRTGSEGAVMVRLDELGVRAETFKTGKHWATTGRR